MQVSPTELVLKPGQTVKLRARLFDAQGTLPARGDRGDVVAAGAEGHASPTASFTAAGDPVEQAGTIKATVGALSGEARARVVRPLPWTETFDRYADGAVPPGWINAAAGKFSVVTLDGQKVLQKAADNTIFKRVRAFIGPTDWSNYTFEADVRGTTRRRQMADIGITAQRYSLVLYGNRAAAEARAVGAGDASGSATVPFAWKADTWYHLKLRVENTAGRQGARARQGVADRRSRSRRTWMIDKIDPIGNRQGAPGFFVDAEFGAYLDNLKLTANQ